MKHIKPFIDNSGSMSNFTKPIEIWTEIWEVDDDLIITGFSIKITQRNIKELAKRNLIFFTTIDKEAEQVFYDKNREEVELFINTKEITNKYNI